MRPKKEYTLEQIQNDKKLLLKKARELVVLHKMCSVSMIQRTFQIPYANAKAVLNDLVKDEEIKQYLYVPNYIGVRK